MAFMSLTHPDAVLCMLALRVPDCVVTGCQDRLVRIWDGLAWTCVQTLSGHRRSVMALASHRNFLATAGADSSIFLYDLSPGLARGQSVTGPDGIRRFEKVGGFAALSELKLGMGTIYSMAADATDTSQPNVLTIVAGCQDTNVYVLRVRVPICGHEVAVPVSLLSVHQLQGARGFVYSVLLRVGIFDDAAGGTHAARPSSQRTVQVIGGSGDGTIQVWKLQRSVGESLPGLAKEPSDAGSAGGAHAILVDALKAQVVDPAGNMSMNGAMGADVLPPAVDDVQRIAKSVETAEAGPVYALVAHGKDVFAAYADGGIRVFDGPSRWIKYVLRGHTGAVLALCIVEDRSRDEPGYGRGRVIGRQVPSATSSSTLSDSGGNELHAASREPAAAAAAAAAGEEEEHLSRAASASSLAEALRDGREAVVRGFDEGGGQPQGAHVSAAALAAAAAIRKRNLRGHAGGSAVSFEGAALRTSPSAQELTSWLSAGMSPQTASTPGAAGLSHSFLCSGGADGSVRVWSTRTYLCLQVLHATAAAGSLALGRAYGSAAAAAHEQLHWQLAAADAAPGSDAVTYGGEFGDLSALHGSAERRQRRAAHPPHAGASEERGAVARSSSASSSAEAVLALASIGRVLFTATSAGQVQARDTEALGLSWAPAGSDHSEPAAAIGFLVGGGRGRSGSSGTPLPLPVALAAAGGSRAGARGQDVAPAAAPAHATLSMQPLATGGGGGGSGHESDGGDPSLSHQALLHHLQRLVSIPSVSVLAEGSSGGGGGSGGSNDGSGSGLEPGALDAPAGLPASSSPSSAATPEPSSFPRDVNACWRGARYLQSLLLSLGAAVRLVQGTPGSNPTVLGRLGGWEAGTPAICLHAHYDVQPPGALAAWDSPPFALTGRDGFLYARGASDCKGPLLAMVFAAARAHRALQQMRAEAGSDGGGGEGGGDGAAEGGSAGDSSDDSAPATGGGGKAGGAAAATAALPKLAFVFVLEGEGENGSAGYREAVLQNLEWFAHTAWIVSCNTTWIGEEQPCLTYGLRGNVKVRVDVEGPASDLHSGLDGGVTHEPLLDLCALLGGLVEPTRGRIAVPGVYADVAPLTPAELGLYTHHASRDFDVGGYMDARGLRGVYAASNLALAAPAAAASGGGGDGGGDGAWLAPDESSSVGAKRARPVSSDSGSAEASPVDSKRLRAAVSAVRLLEQMPPTAAALELLASRKQLAAAGEVDSIADGMNVSSGASDGAAAAHDPRRLLSDISASERDATAVGGGNLLPTSLQAADPALSSVNASALRRGSGPGADLSAAATASPLVDGDALGLGLDDGSGCAHDHQDRGSSGAARLRAAPAEAPPAVDVEAAVLLRRWREPSLTVHGVACSAANDSIIPRRASGFLSIRTVPHMTSAATFGALAAHLRAQFAARRSVNTLRIAMTAHAAWWLQSPAAAHYQVAARAVERHWGRPPVFVREGGTVRVTTFLEKTFRAPALHLPFGQSSDSPHLPNERLRLLNLVTGTRVLESLFLELSGAPPEY